LSRKRKRSLSLYKSTWLTFNKEGKAIVKKDRVIKDSTLPLKTVEIERDKIKLSQDLWDHVQDAEFFEVNARIENGKIIGLIIKPIRLKYIT
jgi:hypothetical protein